MVKLSKLGTETPIQHRTFGDGPIVVFYVSLKVKTGLEGCALADLARVDSQIVADARKRGDNIARVCVISVADCSGTRWDGASERADPDQDTRALRR